MHEQLFRRLAIALWRGTACCLWLHRSPTLQRCGEGPPVAAQVSYSPALWRGTACLWLHRFPALHPALWRGTACLWLHRSPTLQRCGEGPPACGCTGSLLSRAMERDRSFHPWTALLSLGCWFVFCQVLNCIEFCFMFSF